MKKSAHQIWREAKEHNLTKQEFKKKLIENNVIVKKEAVLEQKFNELIPIEFGGKMDEELLKSCVKICIDFSNVKL